MRDQQHNANRSHTNKTIVLSICAAIYALLSTSLLHSFDLNDIRRNDEFFTERKRQWSITLGGNFGKNKLVRGYKGYSDMTHGGIDIYLRPPLPETGKPAWYHKIMFRLSGDYFPLQTPEGVYGLDEDIYSLNFGVVYRIMSSHGIEGKKWVPILGAGFGIYRDEVTLDTPASGVTKGITTDMGINGSVGIMLPAILHLRLIPEIRYHSIRIPGNYWTANITYQVGVVLWFEPKVIE